MMAGIEIVEAYDVKSNLLQCTQNLEMIRLKILYADARYLFIWHIFC